MKNKDLILEILLKAVKREIEAYTYYIKAMESSPYPETKSLLAQLAEEERKHRQLLLREYRALRGMFQKSKPRASYLTKKRVNYQLPADLPFKKLPYIPAIDLAAISLPTEFMGGDYLETFPFLSQDEELAGIGILLCDIMGHALEAAQLKGLAKSTLANIMGSIQSGDNKAKALETSFLVRRINKLLWEPCRKADSFLTLFYCFLSLRRKRLIYTSAGHNPPLLFSDYGSKYMSLANTQLVIGILKEVDYSQTEVKLMEGDVLLLYSDGLTEATDKKGKEFGIQRLVGSVQEHYSLSSKGMIQQICQALRDFMQDRPLKDELTLAIAKIV